MLLVLVPLAVSNGCVFAFLFVCPLNHVVFRLNIYGFCYDLLQT